MRIELGSYATNMVAPPEMKTPEAIRQWLTDTMAQRGLSTIEWATRAGVARSTLFRALAPDYAFVTSRRTLAKLAAAVDGDDLPGATPTDAAGRRMPAAASGGTGGPSSPGAREALVTAANPPSFATRRSPHALPLRFEIQHGAWFECLGPDFSIFFEGDVPNFEPDGRYGRARQWLELVRDDSADLQILPLSFAHVVDAGDIHYGPRQADWVVVERTRAGGQLTERTIRQVDIRGEEAHLILRSSNPKWGGGGEACVVPTAGTSRPEGATDVGVSIAGLVIGAYRRW